MATVTRFEDLEVWKLAREQARVLFSISQTAPFSRDFGLKNQLNDAAGSVMDNVAEGFERFSNKEFSQFLIIAKGSNGEVRSQLYRAFDRQYITEELLTERLDFSVMLGNKLKSFIDYLGSSPYKRKPSNKD